MGEGTAAVEEVSTEAAVAADFMEGEAGFTAVEVLVEEAEATLSLADTHMADIAADMAAEVIEAATMVAAAFMVVTADMDGEAGATAGAAEAGAMEEVGVGAGDLATAGRIGDMAGAIRMATMATRITRHTLIILTRPTALPRTI